MNDVLHFLAMLLLAYLVWCLYESDFVGCLYKFVWEHILLSYLTLVDIKQKVSVGEVDLDMTFVYFLYSTVWLSDLKKIEARMTKRWFFKFKQ